MKQQMEGSIIKIINYMEKGFNEGIYWQKINVQHCIRCITKLT